MAARKLGGGMKTREYLTYFEIDEDDTYFIENHKNGTLIGNVDADHPEEAWLWAPNNWILG